MEVLIIHSDLKNLRVYIYQQNGNRNPTPDGENWLPQRPVGSVACPDVRVLLPVQTGVPAGHAPPDPGHEDDESDHHKDGQQHQREVAPHHCRVLRCHGPPTLLPARERDEYTVEPHFSNSQCNLYIGNTNQQGSILWTLYAVPL